MTLEINGPVVPGSDEILTPAALDFLELLHQRFAARRDELLRLRADRRAEVARTGRLDFLDRTADIRGDEWQVVSAPADLADRRVEITGPPEPKMAINALNSGARVWLADLEDANTPHWANVVGSQLTLSAAIRGTLSYTSPDGREYALRTDQRLATIVARPRGWHMDEKHLVIDGRPAIGALVDFGLYFFTNAAELIARGSGPYFYLPKIESHLEARLWAEIFELAERELGTNPGSIRATVLIETIPAAFEMDEILYELRAYASGLNAGRWDYLFSMIKYFRDSGPEFVLPDRASVTMGAPFMRAYAELLVKTCHRRGAFAMGGMAAFIPSRRDAEANARAFAKVREDKLREATAGFDGSWVAHPDLVAVCRETFDEVLGDRPNQLDRQRPDVAVVAADLLDVRAGAAGVTTAGIRSNVEVALLYLEAWLAGNGAVGIHNLMEDAATAEISRSQLWQWLHNDVVLEDGSRVTPELVDNIVTDVVTQLRASIGADAYDAGRYADALAVFTQVALTEEFPDFLTGPAYDYID